MDIGTVEQRLWQKFYEGCTMRGMVNAIADIFGVPVRFVPYGDFSRSVMSDSFPQEDTELTQKYTTTEGTKETFRTTVIDTYSKKSKDEAMYLHSSADFHSRVIGWVTAKEHCFGALTLLVPEEDFPKYPKELVNALTRITGAAAAVNSYADEGQASGSIVLLKLLRGDIGGYFQLGFYSLDEVVIRKKYFRLLMLPVPVRSDCERIVEQLPQRLKKLWYAWNGGSLVMLLASNHKPVNGAIEEALSAIGRDTGRCAAIGSAFCDLLECQDHFEQILSIPLYRKNAPGVLVRADEWRECGLFMKSGLTPSELKHYVSSELKDMQDYDRANGTSYFATLRAYMQNDLNPARTASALFVHYNTVQYRIGRINQLFGIDAGNASSLFQVQLSFRILEYIGEETAPDCEA